jgi:GntR family transcriptional regulator, N-acetylglucosamine utilization regulator
MTSSQLAIFIRAAPRHYQLAENIRQKIENREWLPHEQIPSERELESLYKVSRTTVRQAVTTLISRGYLYHIRGRGTFVARPKLDISLLSLTSFSDDMRARGLEPGQKILSLGYEEISDKLRERLELAKDIRQILKLERLRLGNGEPVGIHIAYLPLAPGETISIAELEQTGSLYKLLESKFALVPGEADETLEATAASEREAKLLRIKTGRPVLLIERATWASDQRPLEFCKMIYRADRYKYYTHLRTH